jgi:hypothetical protein
VKTSNLKRRLPSPAMVVAVIALVIGLAGGAYAATVAPMNSVRSGSILNGQVRAEDIANRTIRGADIAVNSLGRGVIAENAITAGELAEVTEALATTAAVVDPDGMANAGGQGLAVVTATCPEGTTLLSGGARWIGDNADKNVYLQEQYRSGVDDNSWTVEGLVDIGAQGSVRLQAQAYCLVSEIVPS